MDKAELTTLVARAGQGDGDAFAQVYQASFQHVYYTAKKILRDEQQAQDITSEVYITAYQKISQLRDPGAFMGWLRQITAYKCANHMQKKKEVLYAPAGGEDDDSGLPDVEADISEQPDAVLEKASTKQIILDIINKLPEERRAVVLMFYFQQLTIPEIAAATGKAEGTVKSALNAARKQIKMAVEKEEERSNIKLHSISAAFLFRLLAEDAAAAPAPAIAQGILQKVVQQGVGQAATAAGSGAVAQGTVGGSAGSIASTGAAAGKLAVSKGFSLGMKIGLVAAGLAVTGAVVGFVALGMGGSGDAAQSLPASQPAASAAAPAVPGVSSSDASAPEDEQEAPAIGLPLFGENDLAFLSRYLYPGNNADEAAAELAAYLGTEPIVNTSAGTDTKRDERNHYFMDDITSRYDPATMDLEGIALWNKWYTAFGQASDREYDCFQLSVTMGGYSILGIEHGMELETAHAQAQRVMALEGLDIVEFKDYRGDENSLLDGFWLRFFYDGREYLLTAYCARGETVIQSVGLSGKGADKEIDDLGWIG